MQVPADLLSLKDGTIEAGGSRGVGRREAWSWLAAGERKKKRDGGPQGFYQTHMHAAMTPFTVSQNGEWLALGEGTRRKNRK